MVLNITIPLAEQLWGDHLYELAALGNNDSDEKDKTEKEEKEKEIFSSLFDVSHKGEEFDLRQLNDLLYAHSHALISENYASMPELPPEA